MFLLTASIRKTANILGGWMVGNLVIEDDGAFIQLDCGDLVPVVPSDIIEVHNNDQWQRLNEHDLKARTVEGWPAYAGMDARVKH